MAHLRACLSGQAAEIMWTAGEQASDILLSANRFQIQCVLCKLNNYGWATITMGGRNSLPLGIYIIKGHCFKCSLNHAKQAFYRSANSIFGKIGRVASEEAVLDLI